MIVGILNPGSGIGDMIFSYIATRVRATDLGVPFGFIGKEFWKGKGWMDLDFGEETGIKYIIQQPAGKLMPFDVPVFTLDKSYYDSLYQEAQTMDLSRLDLDIDPKFFFIPDGTVIDGYGAQSEQYWGHRLDEIREWLKVSSQMEQYYTDEDICVVNIRGGEYRGVPELFLPKEYWIKAMDIMKEKYPKVIFEIHSDDLELATTWFPEYKTFAGNYIDLNWQALRYAKHSIISNSAFAIIPRLLAHLDNEDSRMQSDAITIAPFGWNARNKSLTKWEGRPQNYYSKFLYV